MDACRAVALLHVRTTEGTTEGTQGRLACLCCTAPWPASTAAASSLPPAPLLHRCKPT